MPFIRGRYYANPTYGRAVEAAREAEDALRASQGDSDVEQPNSQDEAGAGPLHRIEIEVAEMVPAQSGRATTGYVARVHRGSGAKDGQAAIFRAPAEKRVFYDPAQLVSFLRDELDVSHRGT
jgi:hypothetical protein